LPSQYHTAQSRPKAPTHKIFPTVNKETKNPHKAIKRLRLAVIEMNIFISMLAVKFGMRKGAEGSRIIVQIKYCGVTGSRSSRKEERTS
jgi:hypothetical protein